MAARGADLKLFEYSFIRISISRTYDWSNFRFVRFDIGQIFKIWFSQSWRFGEIGSRRKELTSRRRVLLWLIRIFRLTRIILVVLSPISSVQIRTVEHSTEQSGQILKFVWDFLFGNSWNWNPFWIEIWLMRSISYLASKWRRSEQSAWLRGRVGHYTRYSFFLNPCIFASSCMAKDIL